MPLLLPAESVRSLPARREAVETQILRMKEAREDGFLRLTGARERILTVLAGEVGVAGEWSGGSFAPIAVDRFWDWVDLADAVEVAKSSASARALPLLFGGVLTARLPADWVEGRPLLLDSLRRAGTDVILAIRRGEVFSLALCPGGVPSELHLGPEETVPPGSNPAEQVTFMLVMNPDLVVDVYESDEALRDTTSVILPQGARPAPSVEPAPRPAVAATVEVDDFSDAPALLVLLGERIVWRFRPKDATFSIGRGSENDVPLNNLSVSRRHARGHVRSGTILLEDLGSENGLVVGAKRQARVELRPGDRVRLGKYELMLATGTASSEVGAPEPAAAGLLDTVSIHETMAINSAAVPLALIEHDGRTHKISGLVFAIGTAPEAHLPIAGTFIAPVHVRILRSPDGTHVATHVAGWRRMTINGRVTKEAALLDGDVIAIGSHTVTFRHPAAPAPLVKVSRLGPSPSSS